MENIKLSIAIPTFNGAKYIREALDSIISQLDEINEKIEIVISDNASTDETPQIIEEYQKKYPGIISYYRNDSNLGISKNYDLAILRSKGNYVWLLGDDDMLERGAIRKVIEIIKKYNNLSWIFVNYNRYDNRMGKEHGKVVNLNRDYYCYGEDFFRITKFASATFSSNIVRKEEWRHESFEKYEHIAAKHPHVVLAIYLLKDRYSYIISFPYVKFRSPDRVGPRWVRKSLNFNEEYLILGLNMLNSFFYALKENNYSHDLFLILLKSFRSGLLLNMLRLKKDTQHFSPELLTLIKGLYKIDKILFVFSIILVNIPTFILKGFYHIYIKLKKLK